MKKTGVMVGVFLIGLVLTSGLVFAHEGHSKKGATDQQMQKLHAMMPMFSVASARLETALQNKDTATAEKEANKILQAIPDLKKSRPHRNFKRKMDFVALAGRLEQKTTMVLELSKKGEFVEASTAFKAVEETCAACHDKFR